MAALDLAGWKASRTRFRVVVFGDPKWSDLGIPLCCLDPNIVMFFENHCNRVLMGNPLETNGFGLYPKRNRISTWLDSSKPQPWVNCHWTVGGTQNVWMWCVCAYTYIYIYLNVMLVSHVLWIAIPLVSHQTISNQHSTSIFPWFCCLPCPLPSQYPTPPSACGGRLQRLRWRPWPDKWRGRHVLHYSYLVGWLVGWLLAWWADLNTYLSLWYV